ncbi:MAG: histone-lysine N-methyltransferase [Deltaproteobacteria bacterium]|jgi:isopropylmalate/homocitrate/citramalate synthase|nr:histone-lysine N-methyltransferase [Deltaproteobacteria bacterium]
MSLLHRKNSVIELKLKNRAEPELYRDFFPYSQVGRVSFGHHLITPAPADPMFITDTTFRDGQQARPPYKPRQIRDIYRMMHELGGRSGLIRASEFFMYTEKDRKAIELCRALDYKFPRVTGWIRANLDDLKMAKSMEFKEVGMLTSVSDYHIYLKMGWDREKAFNHYVKMVGQALEWGISPRCHFEDVTRADIYGFCLPFAEKLMEMSKAAGLPVKIRLCDTLGNGVPYAGANLPRSVPGIIAAFINDAGVPGEYLEWHGHNDFHKVQVNAVTAWLHGCSGVNGTMFGFGERTGNAPIEAMVIEYISLTGEDDAANLKVITEMAHYFSTELDYRIPDNYPFAGREFNATSAGIHVDGLAKNPEIYNIFDTDLLLGKPSPVIITDKSGRAGVAYWVNHELGLQGENKIQKGYPGVGKIYERINQAYEKGRTTSFSSKEMRALCRRFLPELFITDFTRLKQLASSLAADLVMRIGANCKIKGTGSANYPWMQQVVEDYDFIQYLHMVDTNGKLIAFVVSDPQYQELYEKMPLGYDFSGRQWFIEPMKSGGLHITDIYQSHFTDKLILTVSTVLTDEKDDIAGVVAVDIQLEELLQRAELMDAEKEEDDEQQQS